MRCKNCKKELPPKDTLTTDNFPGKGYYDYCDSYCYAIYHKKYSSLAYQRGAK